MDNIETHRKIIHDVLQDYHFFLDTYSLLNSKLIINREATVYVLVLFGEYNHQSIYEWLVHLEITDREIHLLCDKINFIHKLLIRGINKDFIVNKNYRAIRPNPEDLAVNIKKLYELNKTIFASEFDAQPPIIKPDVTAAELIKLAKIDCNYIGKAIAKHPNIPVSLLIELFRQFPAEVFNNPSFNLFFKKEDKFLDKLYHSFPNVFNWGNFKVPDFFIEWAVNHENEEIRASIANSHTISIPINLLEKLVNDDSCKVITILFFRFEYYNYDKEDNNYPEYYIKKQINRKYLYFKNNCPQRKKEDFENIECDCDRMFYEMGLE